MKIMIIRHGEPDYTIDSLTEKGFKEAKLLADRLEKISIDDFYCSPLGRARDTAKPTLERFDKKLEILPWLREFSGSINTEHSKNRIPWDLPPSYWANDARFFSNSEWIENELMNTGNVREVLKETQEGIDALLARYGYQRNGILFRCDAKDDEPTIALFCHFGMGAVIMSHLTGISPIILWHSFFMAPSSVTTLVTERDDSGDSLFRCVQMGDTSHLYAGDEPMSESGLFPDFYK